jgi:hypothetical protein
VPVRPADDANLLLPPGSVLVHIGPFKTGSSALQMSLHVRRDAVRLHGVLYPGTTYRHLRPIAAVMGRGPRGVPSVPEHEWTDLVAEIDRAAASRAIVSSEGLSTAGTRVVKRLVDDLGADRVHVVRVERRLDRLLPSAWQERVKSSNETRSFPDFLDDVLTADPATAQGPRTSFWAAHSLEKFLDRWRSALPDERIHVVVADDGNPLATTACFERMLGLPAGMLDPTRRPNSSLSWERVELCRRLNQVFDERGWPDRLRRRLLQGGVVRGLRDTPVGAHDTRIPPVTGERLRRTAELSARRIDLLGTCGVDVIGDPETTRVVAHPTPEGRLDPLPPDSIPIAAVVAAVERLMVDASKSGSGGKRRPGRGHRAGRDDKEVTR